VLSGFVSMCSFVTPCVPMPFNAPVVSVVDIGIKAQVGRDCCRRRDARRASPGINLIERAIDEHDAELDVPVQKRRGNAAAKRVFRRVLRSNPAPRWIVTDRLCSYPAAKATPELAQVRYVSSKRPHA
jgi:hypothetical protein